MTDQQPERRHRNGHILELQDVDWRCAHCGHWFDAEADADAFWCGDPCRHAEPCIPQRFILGVER